MPKTHRRPTTQDAIDNLTFAPGKAPSIGDLMKSDGFKDVGDGGSGTWEFKGIDGQTPSQSPAQLADALLNDPNGNQWEFLGDNVSLLQLGAAYDASDETAIFVAAKTWSNRTSGTVTVNVGTIFTTPIQIFGIDAVFIGVREDDSIIKLVDGTNDHLVATLSNGGLRMENLTLDANRANQTAGHGIRYGGTKFGILNHVTIINSFGYGIGVQNGTNNKCTWENLTIDGCGVDAIDIKDFNFDNEVITINNFTARNYGLISTGQVAIDARGPVLVNNATAEIFGDNTGFRYRGDEINGRGGSGVMSNLRVTGDGVSTNSQAFKFENDHIAGIMSGCVAENVSIALLQTANGIGGVMNGLVAEGIYGESAISALGKDFYASDITLKNTLAGKFVLDIHPSAINAQFDGFYLEDISTLTNNSIRIQTGAVDSSVRGTMRGGGGVNDTGTNSVVDVRLI